MARLIISLYRILGNILIWPAALLLSRHANFRSTILARLGISLPEVPANRKVIWIHASSVGEVKAVSGLIRELKSDMPHLFVCMSCMTVTGRQVAAKIPDIEMVMPFPFDLAWIMQRYLKCLRPELLMIVETEVWPNMILMAARARVPVVFVNARMTDRSYGRFSRMGGVIREVFKDVSVFAMAQSDAARFSRLGAPVVEVLGNLKLDHIGNVDMERRRTLKKELGVEDRPVFIAGSIREGEEKDVMDAVAYAASQIKDLYSIVTPRHPGMLAQLKELADTRGIRWGLRSVMPGNMDLLFVDTFGELFDLYGSADVAFVGGSLKNLGGQNILEPIAWGVPTIHGPHMDNFLWALDVVKGSTVQVDDSSGLGPAVTEVLSRRDTYQDMASRARKALNDKQGVNMVYVEALKKRFI